MYSTYTHIMVVLGTRMKHLTSSPNVIIWSQTRIMKLTNPMDWDRRSDIRTEIRIRIHTTVVRLRGNVFSSSNVLDRRGYAYICCISTGKGGTFSSKGSDMMKNPTSLRTPTSGFQVRLWRVRRRCSHPWCTEGEGTLGCGVRKTV